MLSIGKKNGKNGAILMFKLLIVDGTDDFRTAMAQALKDRYIVRTCGDGEAALEYVRAFLPDILILDLTLPGVDGLSLIQIISESQIKPVILATTRFNSDYVLEASSRIGVDYMMLKPCNIRAITTRLEDLVNSRQPRELVRPDPRVTVANLLLVLGIGTNRKGYNCLREAIPIYARDTHQSITKELYPAVAKACNAGPVQVERSMRVAIEKAWLNRDDQIWRLYFSPRADGTIHKPTNSEFISRLADYLILKQDSLDGQ